MRPPNHQIEMPAPSTFPAIQYVLPICVFCSVLSEDTHWGVLSNMHGYNLLNEGNDLYEP